MGRDAIEYAQSIQIDAQVMLGSFLKAGPKNPGTRTKGGGTGAGGAFAEPPANIPTIKDLGILNKVGEQREFVQWWEGAVSVSHGAGRGNKKSAGRGAFSMERAEALSKIKHQQVSRWRKRLADEEKYSADLYGATYRRAMAAESAHVAYNAGGYEWYTPAEYIAAAFVVMGDIDLDPASSEEANAVVQAKEFFDAEDDGLSRPWAARVWLSPPYASNLIGRFIKKFCGHLKSGEVSEAIMSFRYFWR